MIRYAVLLSLLLTTIESAKAELFKFQIDPNQSAVVYVQSLSDGTTTFHPLELYPGSLTSYFTGSINTSVDLQQGTISFIGGSQVAIANSNMLPLSVDPSGIPVEFASKYDFGNGNTLLMALSDQVGEALDPPSGPIQMTGIGPFFFSSTILFAGSQVGWANVTKLGVVGPLVNSPLQGIDVVDANLATLSQTDSTHWTLRMPLSMSGTGIRPNPFGGPDFTRTEQFIGYIVATATVPEESTITLIAVVCGFASLVNAILADKRRLTH